ncbi:hypothetical protein NC981_24795 [Leptolyngbya sp. DQ-M1]
MTSDQGQYLPPTASKAESGAQDKLKRRSHFVYGLYPRSGFPQISATSTEH